MAEAPYNAFNRPTVVSKAYTAIATNTSGNVTVTAPIRKVRKAHANFDYVGAGSGRVVAVVVQTSGSQADVALLKVTSGSNGLTYIEVGSTTGYSGGTLTVWFEGDP